MARTILLLAKDRQLWMFLHLQVVIISQAPIFVLRPQRSLFYGKTLIALLPLTAAGISQLSKLYTVDGSALSRFGYVQHAVFLTAVYIIHLFRISFGSCLLIRKVPLLSGYLGIELTNL